MSRWAFGVCLVAIAGTAGNLRGQSVKPPYDLIPQSGRDPNGLMLNPRWATDADPLSVDPVEECGLLAKSGPPGHRKVLLRNPDCFSSEQRTLMRLNEPRSLRVFGDGCGQGESDGSVQGHVNWFPVTITGTLRYNETSTTNAQRFFDFDHAFDLAPDSGLRIPATRFNPNTTGDSLAAHLPDHHQSVHVELDLRETSSRVDASMGWWGAFGRLARKDSWEVGNRLVGSGRAVVTGVFGLDAVHEGHAEIHPVFGMAFERVSTHDANEHTRDEEWVFLARDRGNEGNCASGIVPFILTGTPQLRDTFRLRLPEPDSVSGRPEILEGTWVAASEPESEAYPNPRFIWSPGHGLDVLVSWPREKASPDATMLGVLKIRWRGIPSRPAVLSLSLARRVAGGPRRKKTRQPTLAGAPEDTVYYDALARRRLALRELRGTVVDSATEGNPHPPTDLPVEKFDVEPSVDACHRSGSLPVVDIHRNSRCIGESSLVGETGAAFARPIGGRNLFWAVGIRARSLDFPKALGDLFHPTFLIEYRRNPTLAPGATAVTSILAKLEIPAIGNVAYLPGAYLFLQPGLGKMNHTGETIASFAAGFGVRAPIPGRTLISPELQLGWVRNQFTVDLRFVLERVTW